ncbi:conserved domain protein [Parvimonas sp. oral taxon 393 str. F0440]|nr:conserved domain protein [Parvimonas sp. oral taxon 393 str. F0440]
MGFVVMLFIGGSRGPFIFIITFIIMYWLLEFSNRNNFLKYKNKLIVFFQLDLFCIILEIIF